MYLTEKYLKIAALVVAVFIGVFVMAIIHRKRASVTVTRPGAAEVCDNTLEIRPEPARFPARTHMPDVRESVASGSIDLGTFSPGRSLMYIDDPRVWWESDHDKGDEEDDHTVNVALAAPLRRLIELVSRAGGKLKVQDTYRPTGIHNRRSLHKEGRAIDVTCDGFSLEKLAKLCWVAGFDWVYYESKRGNGAHIHCSVRRRDDMAESAVTMRKSAR